ncbi:MAG: InlB B-repeat-containing protein, partial [Bacteroidales bacterium]|nr:InlB B-repeat-containing protein [Bacteroidales bacterium]
MLKYYLQLVVCLCVCALGIPSAWAEETTLDFHFSSMGSTGWDTNYKPHTQTFDEGTVKFASANKNSSTITDIPVTKGGDVTFALHGSTGTISSVTWICRQWGTKAQTITLHYSTDGGENYTSTKITSTNFTITDSNLPSGTNAVKITFSSTSNQIGIESLTYEGGTPNNLNKVNIVSYRAGNDSVITLTRGDKITPTVYADQPEWTPAYVFTSANTNIVTVDANGEITAVSKGTTDVIATLDIASNDEHYTKGSKKADTIRVTVKNPLRHIYYSVNNDVQKDTLVEEGSPITSFFTPSAPEGWTFMGWVTDAIAGTQSTAPTYVNTNSIIKAGESDITYYAVFAKGEVGQSSNWVKKTIDEVVTNPLAGVYALITGDGHAFKGTISGSGHGETTSEAFAFTNNIATTAPSGTCELTITRKGEGIEIKNSNGEILYAKGTTSGNLAWHNSDNNHWNVRNYNLCYSGNTAYLRHLNNSSFRTYGKTSDGTGAVAFAYKATTVYNDFCTTISGSDQRQTISLASWEKEVNGDTLVRDLTLNTLVTLNHPECTTAIYNYTTSNAEVATISNTGVITAVGKGPATLTVTLSIDANDPDYKIGGTTTLDLNVIVVNPTHTVTFVANEDEVGQTSVREGEIITFPTVISPSGLTFVGWTATALNNLEYDEPALVDVKATPMGTQDITYYAVFARIAQLGLEEGDSLTAEMILEHFTQTAQPYETEERTWADGIVTWTFNGQGTQGKDYLQINRDHLSYIKITAPYAIKRVTLSVANGSGRDYSGSIYIKEEPSKPSEENALYSGKGARTCTIDITNDYNTIYIQASNPAQISKIVLTCMGPSTFSGYVTSADDANTNETTQATISECGYTTVCLPFNAVSEEGSNFYYLRKIDSEGMHFSRTDILVAGQGYLLEGNAN